MAALPQGLAENGGLGDFAAEWIKISPASVAAAINAPGPAFAYVCVSPATEVAISLEVELKLAVEPADLAALEGFLAERAFAPGAVSQRLVSTYFDTAEFDLQRCGLVLRVRDKDGQFVQTLKRQSPAAANPLARGEWEDPVSGIRPELDAAHSGARIPARLAAALHPVFITEIERVAIAIQPRPGTVIEAAIDRGTIRTPDGGATEPVSEIELELKDGDPAALYDLALELLKIAPLRIDLRSKAERGYHLAGGGAEIAAAATEPVRLAAEMSVEDALQRVGRACLVQLLRSEPRALAGKVEGVHQMRVAMRRLRSMLSAVKLLLPEIERRRVADEIKEITEPLGEARNLDVFATELLAPARQKAADQHGWAELSAAAETARVAAYQRVGDAIRSPAHTATLLRLLRWFEAREWRQAAAGAPDDGALGVAIGTVAPAVLDHRRRMVRKRSRHFRRLSAGERHRLRIAVKKLRYAAELLASLYDERQSQRFIKRLKWVQDELGHANDVRIAYGLVIELGRAAAAVGPIADAGAEMLARHQLLLARRDKKLRRRLRRLNTAHAFWRGSAAS